MRILHVLDHGLPTQSGYSFRTRALMKAQQRTGWTVAGLTGVRQGPASRDGDHVDGLDFYRTPPVPRWLGAVSEVAALADRLDQCVDVFRPDLLHAHSPVLSALAAQRVARRRGLPLVYEIRAFWEDAAVGNGAGRAGSLRYRTTRWLETRACHRADAVFAICAGLHDDLVARGVPRHKLAVVPNAVDLELFGRPPSHDPVLAAQLGLAGDVIGFVGSFYDYEGLDDLIAAMPLLPGATLLLVGGGPSEPALRAQAAASPAADRIVFAGRVPHDDVERYYALIDVLAYPRKRMRLTELVTPLKPLEAMAQRRLVAASDVGGHRELIEDAVTGTLFPPGDPVALAASLARLLADRGAWDERRDAARAFVERERNWSFNIWRYRAVYERLLGQ